MTGKKCKWRTERGAVQIVEASFVFPIMFIVLLTLIYMGNAFFVKAQVESVVETYALKGAKYCADPILASIEDGGGVPSIGNLDVEPYRYLFGGMDDLEREIGREVADILNGKTASGFNNMKPKVKTPQSKIAKFNNYVVYSTFSVEVDYTLTLPIRFLGAAEPEILKIKARAEVPTNDTAEFIRNTDMVIDILHGTKIGQSVSTIFGKVNDFITKFAGK